MRLRDSFSLRKIAILISLLFLIGGLFLIFKNKPNVKEQQLTSVFLIEEGDRYEIRSSTSSYTIIEFLDMDCVYCKDLHERKKKYRAEFQNINLIIRNYPLLNSGRSAYKVLVGECVAQQMGDEGWFSYIDKSFYFFEEKFNHAFFKELGRGMVSDNDRFENCLKSSNLMDKIASDRIKNQIKEVTYVPTFVVLKDGILIKKYDGITTNFAIEILRYYSNLSQSEK